MKNKFAPSLQKLSDQIENNGMFISNITSMNIHFIQDEKEKDIINAEEYVLINLSVLVPVEDQGNLDKS